nr:helix-turn-helix transcriptional regulator [Pseudomonas sp.]
MDTLAARLQELMRSHGIKSQSQLARRARVAQSSINRILRNPDYAPSLNTLTKLADSLGVSAVWLANGRGPIHIVPALPEASSRSMKETPAQVVLTDSRLDEALSILQRMDDTARGKVLDVLRLIDRPRPRSE